MSTEIIGFLTKRSNKPHFLMVYRPILRRLTAYKISSDLSMRKKRGNFRARELVGLMVDTICTTMPYVRVGREEMPAEVVRSRLLKLNSTHIEHVVDSINRNTTMVRNIRQYMLTSLFNSVNSAACSLTIQVNHDMYGCGDSTEKRR